MVSTSHTDEAGISSHFKIDNEKWKIRDLIAKTQSRMLTVPRFQRGRRWDEKKQERLIDSLFQGYPISALIVHRHPEGETLVDGLQRATTFADYGSQPLESAPPDRVLTEEQGVALVIAIADELGVDIGTPPNPELVDTTLDVVRTWARHTRSLDPGAFNVARLVDALRPVTEDALALAGQAAGSPDTAEAAELAWLKIANALNRNAYVNTLINRIEKQVDIGDKEIPVLLFQGRLGLLAEIFERMNENVVPLSKYEIFAASWSGHIVTIPEPYSDLNGVLRRRYQSFVEDTGVGIDDFDPDEASLDDITLFEFLYALSHHLAGKFPNLFPAKEIGPEVPTAAFQISCLALGVDIEDMDELPAKLLPHLEKDGRLDPTPLIEAIIKACELVDEFLGPLIAIKWKASTSGSKVFIAHSDSQINSIIARTLVGQFSPRQGFTPTPRREAASDLERLRAGVASHYVRDILEGEWRGNTFAKAYERVWQEPNTAPSSFYSKPLDSGTLRSTLDSWFEGGIETRTRARSQPTLKDRLFLQCFYGIFGAADVMTKVWHTDHIVPVNPMKAAIIGANDAGLPINCIANLAAVPRDENLRKGQKQLEELLRGRRKDAWARLVEKYYFVAANDVPLVPNVPQSGRLSSRRYESFRDGYQTYLRDRWAVLRETALEHFTEQGWLAP